MAKTAEGHIWRTKDGDLVASGFGPSGSVLAYAPGDELSDADAKALAAKSRPKAQDKSRTKSEDK